MDGFGSCHSCDREGWVKTENCEVCSNRIIAKNGWCVLKECPEDKPLMDYWGGCHSCDTERGMLNIENCEVCPNRHKNKNGWCVLN